jgi:hypothetical protein
MLHILLADLRIAAGHQVTRWPVEHLARLKGKPVRIVFDDEKALLPVLRGLCANDAGPIELLDIDKHRWGFVFYDTSRLRSACKALGLPTYGPEVQWLPGTNGALWLIGRLTTESNNKDTCASNLSISAI